MLTVKDALLTFLCFGLSAFGFVPFSIPCPVDANAVASSERLEEIVGSSDWKRLLK